MNGWGGAVARVAETAVSALDGYTLLRPGDQITRLGQFRVEATGAAEDDEGQGESRTFGGDFVQVRESARVVVVVEGADGSQIDLYAAYRAIRGSLSEAGYEDPIVDFADEVEYLADGKQGKLAAAAFEVSARRGVQV